MKSVKLATIQELCVRLQQSQREIEVVLRGMREGTLQISALQDGNRGFYDQAQFETISDTSVVSEQELSRELKKIERALERMRTGRYGICTSCSKNISLQRLTALPHVDTCLECQKTREGDLRPQSQRRFVHR